ncbi:MAG: UbiX family flavin prenyltransferase [Desulfobacteraceae bacterium]|nr:MAG: UbiX family flavin prenyltransferase [Desulfobacteraceae bacterium]
MIAVAITGASGPIMGIRLIEELLENCEEVYAVVSTAAWQIIEHELSFKKKGSFPLTDLITNRGKTANTGLLKEFDDKDFFSPLASGSTLFEAMVVIPCSMKTLSGIAHGYADSLITRACDVAIKEKRKLIIVPRETPLSIIHIENMHKLALAGAIILPPVLSFYTLPKSTDAMVDFITGKILNLLGKKNTLFESWGNSHCPAKETEV